MLRDQFIAILVAVAAIVVSGGALAQGNSPAGGATYKVLVISAQTGPTAAFAGKILLPGIEAGVDDLNAHGGLLGKRVEVTSLDDQGDPTKSVSVLQTALASGNRPNMVFATVSSASALAMAPILQRENILTFTIVGSERTKDVSPILFNAFRTRACART